MAATSAAKKSSPATMPIEGYDRLPIKEILPLLTTLSSRDLKGVAAYEKAGKNRVTLLRGIRKIELAREAGRPPRPAKSRLTVVEQVVEETVEVGVEPALAVPAPAPSLAEADLEAVLEAELDAVLDAALQVEPPPPVKAVAAKKPRTRPAVRAATWEEDIEPQLPRRFQAESPAFDLAFDLDLDLPVERTPVAVDEADALAPVIPVPAVREAMAPRPPATRTRAGQMAKKKLENVVLVLAAILAVLLGLAIGTVLARTGGTDPTPPVSASQAAAVHTAG